MPRPYYERRGNEHYTCWQLGSLGISIECRRRNGLQAHLSLGANHDIQNLCWRVVRGLRIGCQWFAVPFARSLTIQTCHYPIVFSNYLLNKFGTEDWKLILLLRHAYSITSNPVATENPLVTPAKAHLRISAFYLPRQTPWTSSTRPMLRLLREPSRNRSNPQR